MKRLEQFLKSVYESIEKRRDSYLEMGMALASCHYLESVVHLSESPVYRRSFASIYESLDEVEVNDKKLLAECIRMSAELCEDLGGYEVYSGDSTFDERPEANTLADRVMKRFNNQKLAYGYESYWTVRLGQEDNSWAGVMNVKRMKAKDTVTQSAAEHMAAIDGMNVQPKLFVFDAGYGIDILKTQQECAYSEMILRLKGHQVFYDAPKAEDYQGRGRRRLHGERFKLSEEVREADEDLLIDFKTKRLRIARYKGLHHQRYPDVQGQVLSLSFLDAQDKPIFKKPIWLYVSSEDIEPEIIARAYLWRSAHELSFRFMKQHLGLSACRSPEAQTVDHWYRLVALAMNMLLALRDDLMLEPKPWYPQSTDTTVSQRQAQRQALAIFLKLTPVTKVAQPSGKGHGRAKGYHPAARTRHFVKRKTKKQQKPCSSCPLKAAA